MAIDLIIGCRDRLHEISSKLEKSHLTYLQIDDSPQKLQQRHKLEGFIGEYLCLVPNEHKYIFQETADILHRSAATLRDFSGYRAVTAWSAISLYAANLLSQPWRKEYRTLRTYSGYYKHEVEANLIGAELMFERMGYKHAGLGILILEGPVDSIKVSNVSRDAIVAFVECQILKQIWESVSQNYSISWLEVLEFRENHVGTPEQAIRALKHRFLEKLYQCRTKSDRHTDCVDAISASIPYRTLPPNYSATMPPFQLDYGYIQDADMTFVRHGCFPTDRGMTNRCDTFGYLSGGNKCFAGMYASPYRTVPPGYATRVPTARLIEVDMPVPVESYDKTYSRKSSQSISDVEEMDYYKKSNDRENYDYDKQSMKHVAEKNSHDMWDFVYKGLERQGYSKDIGNREDTLQRKESDTRITKQKTGGKSTENEEKSVHRNGKRKSSRIDAKPLDVSIKNHETLPLKKKSPSFDLSDSNNYRKSSESQYALQQKDKKRNSQTLPIQRSHRSSEQIAKIADSVKNLELSRSIEDANVVVVDDDDADADRYADTDRYAGTAPNTAADDDDEDDVDDVDDAHKWNCSACTFLNTPNRDICKICKKSKNAGNTDKPLASGGKQCLKCTLVNEKNVSQCVVCNATLENSPTYV